MALTNYKKKKIMLINVHFCVSINFYNFFSVYIFIYPDMYLVHTHKVLCFSRPTSQYPTYYNSIIQIIYSQIVGYFRLDLH